MRYYGRSFISNARNEKARRGWAAPTRGLKVSDVPSGALNLNVDGSACRGSIAGFGHLWQKTYRVHLNSIDVSPQGVVTFWKENLPHLMPADSRFYPRSPGSTRECRVDKCHASSGPRECPSLHWSSNSIHRREFILCDDSGGTS
jgi:hypothetical protein